MAEDAALRTFVKNLTQRSILVENVVVAEWNLSDQEEGGPDQVYLTVDLDGVDASMHMRFRTITTIDEFINTLIESRRRIFPDAPLIREGENDVRD